MTVKLGQDILFGINQLTLRPKFMLSIVLCLALGMGPNTTLFSLINELLFSSVNVASPERLVSIGNKDSDETPLFTRPTSHADFLYLRDHAKSFSGAFATSTTEASLYKNKRSSLITAQLVSSNYFDVLGRKTNIGRTFTASSEFILGRDPYVVMSHDFWQQTYQANPEIIGQSISLNGFEFEVIGVMPADFSGHMAVITPDVWVPMTMAQQMRPDSPEMINSPEHFWLQFHARLNPDATKISASKELAVLSQKLIEQSVDKTPRVYYATDYETFGIFPKAVLEMLSAALTFIGALILLLACASVAALLLSRATERRQEMAVRVALGASRMDIVRQLLVEGFILSLASGVVALLITLWSRKLLLALLPELPLKMNLAMPIDLTVIGYVVIISAISTLVFALAPALQISRLDIMPALKDQPVSGSFEKTTSKMRSFFLVLQFTLSIALLISAGVAVRSMQKATTVETGFEDNQLLIFKTQLSQYGFHGAEKTALAQRLKQSFKAIDGIEQVGIARNAPFGLDRSNLHVSVFDEDATADASQSPARQSYGYTPIDTDFLAAADIDLIAGRNFTELDRDYLAPVAIINQAAAKALFGEQNPLGQYIQMSLSKDAFEVVGIVETVMHRSLSDDSAPFIYVPLSETYGHGLSFTMRTNVAPEQLIERVQQAITEVEPLVAIDGIKTIQQMIALIQLPLALIAWLCGGLGILALVLAVVGVYGSVAYSIQLRQQEVGVRLALGATPNQLIWMLLKKGLLLALVGCVLGVGLAFAMTSIMSIVLIGPAQDPVAFVGVPLLLLGVCILAILLPAYRTSYRQPMAVLRYE